MRFLWLKHAKDSQSDFSTHKLHTKHQSLWWKCPCDYHHLFRYIVAAEPRGILNLNLQAMLHYLLNSSCLTVILKLDPSAPLGLVLFIAINL